MFISGIGGFFASAGSGGSGVTPVGLRGTDQDRSSSGSSLTFTFPVGTQAGDLAVMFTSGDWAPGTPAGWTMLTEANGTNINGEIATKILTSGDVSAGSVSVTFAGTGVCHLAGAVFEGDPNIRDYVGVRSLSSSGTENLSLDAQSGDYALWYAGLDGGPGSPSCTKGSVLETTANSPWLELTGSTLTSGDISAGSVSADWTVETGGDCYVAAVTVIAAAYETSNRVTSDGDQRVTDTGEPRVTYERTA